MLPKLTSLFYKTTWVNSFGIRWFRSIVLESCTASLELLSIHANPIIIFSQYFGTSMQVRYAQTLVFRGLSRIFHEGMRTGEDKYWAHQLSSNSLPHCWAICRLVGQSDRWSNRFFKDSIPQDQTMFEDTGKQPEATRRVLSRTYWEVGRSHFTVINGFTNCIAFCSR